MKLFGIMFGFLIWGGGLWGLFQLSVCGIEGGMEVGMDGGEGEREEGSDKGKNDGLTIFNRGG